MTRLDFSMKQMYAVLAVIGGLPALVILLVVRLGDGQLSVGGQQLAEYDAARLTATLISLLLPVFLLVPPALGAAARRLPSYPPASVGATLLLFGPGILAGILVGGRGLGPVAAALAMLCLLQLCLCLWMACLTRLLGIGTALPVYGAVWGVSGYVDHLRLYVLPYLETAWAGPVGYLNWLLPQIKSGPSLIDDYLASGEWSWQGFGPTLVQIPVVALLWYLAGRNRAEEADTEPT